MAMIPLNTHLTKTVTGKASPLFISSQRNGINERSAKAFIILAVAIILTATFLYQNNLNPQLFAGSWGKILSVVIKISVALFILTLIWRTVLVLRYRSASPSPDHLLPECGVIVPAYNEGHQVLETLKSIVQSDYPREKLKIVVVDDGSRDDTWSWIQKACRQMPNRIIPVRLLHNQGKRRALYAGFRQCSSDIFVTIDSDSQVEPHTIRCLVSPFVQDSAVGAVAGNVRILNRSQGLIPRMLDVSFAFSFDFLRASQSMVNTVMCSPGALSAYRAEIVKQVLPQWINQKFMGRQANIGEDRAMTNLILKQGFHVHFQSTAIVYTKVPTKYRGLCKMLLRWARSNIRETLIMTRFIFTKFRKAPALGARINLILSAISMTVGQIIKVLLLALLVYMPETFGFRMLTGALLAGVMPALFFAYRHRSSDALWAFVYSIFWVTGLWWIALYASLTPQKTGWLTRDLPAKKSPYRVLPLLERPIQRTPAKLKKAA